jgi:prepilin-type N-terminal cleavage/methylation domain-containing protein
MKKWHIIPSNSKDGFTILEIIFAVVIIGILIAVIVPRARRVNVDAKYAGVRQAAAEIGRWGNDWATRNLEAQNPAASCNLNDYILTLSGYVGDVSTPNWTRPIGQLLANDDLTGSCRPAGTGVNNVVADLIPPDSQPRNPFNGLSYFNVSGGNDGSQVQAGVLYLGYYSVPVSGVNHYYFIYTGTDSVTGTQWHAGMGSGVNPFPGLAELRNGIFMARQAP